MARGKAPTPGSDEAAGGAQLGGVAGDGGAHADVLEGLLDRAAVAHAVVDDRQLEPRRSLDEWRSSGQRTLRAGHALLAGVERDGGPQGAGEGLEGGLDHVVGVAAGFHAQVEGELGVGGQRAEELLGELVLEAAGSPGWQVGFEEREGAPEMSIAALARASSMGTIAEP